MSKENLFQSEKIKDKSLEPLAYRLRPKTLADVIGQDHLTGADGFLTKVIASNHLPSIIFWGPAGCGKTTLSHIVSKEIDADIHVLSAVLAGVGDLRGTFKIARHNKEQGRKTILFIDEIHRFNKAQQDSLLPVVEDGTIILIGATTENPSFEVNNALLSRCRVLTINRLDVKGLEKLYTRAEKEMDYQFPLEKEAKEKLLDMADGDARYLLGSLEIIHSLAFKKDLSTEALLKILNQKSASGDRAGEAHYNLISAVHKSLRGSDPQAALYWTARMINQGEDPRYLFRRLTRFASEDIGNADPQAMPLLVSAWQAFERIGQPEGEVHLAQAVIYLALAPKSNASYTAWNEVKVFAEKNGSLMPPKNILNAPTKLMDELGYGKGYQYDHDVEDGFSGQNYFPDELKRTTFYTPVERGFERDLKKRIDYFENLRKKKN
ncbi:MAG: replication-associated recombination protein A [Alphaproteobacteria bacterium]|nr:replication-associated recombination protein A [Alphaproteobacteria bacterium]MBN2780093.1 replication-associated recombination protein A [Alphaproteobacteria bacterium]